jgi:hypothetical protein
MLSYVIFMTAINIKMMVAITKIGIINLSLSILSNTIVSLFIQFMLANTGSTDTQYTFPSP